MLWGKWNGASEGQSTGSCSGTVGHSLCRGGGGTGVFPMPVVPVYSLVLTSDWAMWWGRDLCDGCEGLGPGQGCGVEKETCARTCGTRESAWKPGGCQVCACTSDLLPLSLARVPWRGNQSWDSVTIHTCQILSKDTAVLVWAMVLCSFGI